MKIRRLLSMNKGFTLIEVLLSLTILGIILTGIMQFFSQAYSYTNMNQNKTAAINVARNAQMFIQKESFIEFKKRIQDTPDEYITILICNNKYTKFWKDDTPSPGCEPITINNLEYSVSITPNYLEEAENYYIPVTSEVTWNLKGKEYTTSIEGVIKSEDIR